MHPDHPQPTSFGQRHAITILGVVMFSLLALVCVIQVAC